MSKVDEDRAQQKFADNMREASARVKADAAVSEARKKLVRDKASQIGTSKPRWRSRAHLLRYLPSYRLTKIA